MIYERIDALCKEQKRSIRSVAKEAGLHPSSISKWKESAPSAVSLAKVAKELGVKIEDLLGDDI